MVLNNNTLIPLTSVVVGVLLTRVPLTITSEGGVLSALCTTSA